MCGCNFSMSLTIVAQQLLLHQLTNLLKLDLMNNVMIVSLLIYECLS